LVVSLLEPGKTLVKVGLDHYYFVSLVVSLLEDGKSEKLSKLAKEPDEKR
jgi:hypothetical protein